MIASTSTAALPAPMVVVVTATGAVIAPAAVTWCIVVSTVITPDSSTVSRNAPTHTSGCNENVGQGGNDGKVHAETCATAAVTTSLETTAALQRDQLRMTHDISRAGHRLQP